MTQDTSTYYVWIGGSCDYGHKERAGGAAVVIENNGNIISRDVISDLHTTEFRMMLTLMIKVMQEIPEGSDILFLTNAAYIQNFDKTPTAKSANPDLIIQCIEEKKRHNSVGVKIVQYHKRLFKKFLNLRNKVKSSSPCKQNSFIKPHLGSDILNNRKSLMTLMTVTLMTGKRP